MKRKKGQNRSSRAGWDEYFMAMARVAATRSTCDRNHVGAVITRDNTILSTGYNGSVRGLPHCNEAGHELLHGHCTTTVHAEANAITQAARNGTAVLNGTLYVTSSPCWYCFKLCAQAGIRRIIYADIYGSDLARIKKSAKACLMTVSPLAARH